MRKWRLPTLFELMEAFDYDKGELRIEGFKQYSYYWSSSAIGMRGLGTGMFWSVNLDVGMLGRFRPDAVAYVRGVRVTKKGKLKWSKCSSDRLINYHEALEYVEQLNKRR